MVKARRLVAVAVGAAVLVAVVGLLRGGVEPPPRPVTGPDGERITAYHDAALVTPPRRPEAPPPQPGRLRTDPRRGGALLSWPPAPHAFEVHVSRTDRGQPTDFVRLVAASATSLEHLAPGRYHVEVRAVDQVGRRSEPTSTDLDVSDDAPAWERGLGFVDDFTAGAKLDPTRWRVPDDVRDCIHREGDPGPLVLDDRCGALLSPVSPVMFAESGEVRGRVVVLADVPALPRSASGSGASADRPDDLDLTNYLVVSLAPPAPMPILDSGLQLRIGPDAAFLNVGAPGPGRRLGAPAGTPSPGALHRWELVFTADEVHVHLDGEQVGGMALRQPWQRADLQLAAYPAGADVPVGARVALVGLTGPAPDGRAVELIGLGPDQQRPQTEQRFDIPTGLPTVQQATLTGFLASPGPDNRPGTHEDQQPQPPPDVLADIGGRPVELHRQPSGYPGDPSVWFSAQLPVEAVWSGSTLTVRSVGGAPIVMVVWLELIHEPGTVLNLQQPRVDPPATPVLPQPSLTVRHGDRTIDGSDPAPRGKLEVNVEVDAVPAQAPGREVAGWVALRVELDDRRILDVPTATDGPAVTGSFQFTLDTTDLPDSHYQLVARLISDRPGPAGIPGRATLRLTS